jgi:acyl-CoA synthetase (AMP-forming)/AMP-acid ligase II
MTDFCRQNLTHYKCPKGIDFSPDPLPKTAVGKMLRKEVREKYREIYRTSK